MVTTMRNVRILYIGISFFITWMDIVLGVNCRDRLPRIKCLYLKNHFACGTHPGRMERYCPKTCHFCEAKCKDESPHCVLRIKGAYCFRNALKMATHCPYSCGFCKAINPCDKHQCKVDEKCYLDKHNKPFCRCHIPECNRNKETTPLCTTSGQDFVNLCAMLTERCKTGRMMHVERYTTCKPQKKKDCNDSLQESKYGLCAKWKSYNFCQKVKPTMQYYCPKTCGFCGGDAAQSRVPSPPKTCHSIGYGCCWDNREKTALGPSGEGCQECSDLRFCKRFQMNCGDKHNRSFMKRWCPKCCGYCVNTPCVDKNDHCPSWAEIGECDKNPRYMKLYCRKSCYQC